RPRGCCGGWPAHGRQARADDRHGRRPHLGIGAPRMDGAQGGMTARMTGKVAFCFPGQGSLESGMGREIAEGVPEAMDVLVRASDAAGLDLVRLCFEAGEEELVDTEVQQPALIATSLAMLAAIRKRGLKPDFVVGHSVGEFA